MEGKTVDFNTSLYDLETSDEDYEYSSSSSSSDDEMIFTYTKKDGNFVRYNTEINRFLGEQASENQQTLRQNLAIGMLGGVVAVMGVSCLIGALVFALDPQQAVQVATAASQHFGTPSMDYTILAVGLVGFGSVLTAVGSGLFSWGITKVPQQPPNLKQD